MVKIIFSSVFSYLFYTHLNLLYMYLYNLCFFLLALTLAIYSFIKNFLFKTFQLQQKLCMDIL